MGKYTDYLLKNFKANIISQKKRIETKIYNYNLLIQKLKIIKIQLLVFDFYKLVIIASWNSMKKPLSKLQKKVKG